MRTTLLILSGLLVCATPVSAWTEAVILTTDFSTTGGVGTFLKDSPWTVTPDRETVGGDAVARWHGGLYYVVNRSGSNLQVLDPAQGYDTIRQFSLGVGRNPQDIAFASDGTAYVSCYDTAELLHVDVAASSILDVVSTAAFADADGIPETAWMLAVGDRLFINCQRLDRDNWWLPAGGSSLLVYDTILAEWVDCDPATVGVQPVDLAAENPTTQLELSVDRTFLRVGCTGNYGAQDGGVDRIGLDDLTSWGLEISEVDLDGDLLDFESAGDLCFVIVSGAAFNTSVRWYDRVGLETGVVDQSADYVHSDVAVAAGQVYVADRTLGAEGIRIFDLASKVELTTTPLSTGRPPFMIVLPLDESLSGVRPLAPIAPLALAAPWPNPANPATRIRCSGPAGSDVRLSVHDLRGALVRETVRRVDGEGTAEWLFDGRDSRGRELPSGTYLVRAGGRGAVAVGKVSLVR